MFVTGDNFVVPLSSAAQPPAADPLLFTKVQDFEDKNMRTRLVRIRIDECTPSNLPKMPLKARCMSNDKEHLEDIKEAAIVFKNNFNFECKEIEKAILHFG